MKPYESQLFKFAFFPGLPGQQSTTGYPDRIEYLASTLAAHETWNYSGTVGNTNPILKNYLEFTFRRLKQEKKIKFTIDNKFACFNTGLVTENLEDIYALFEQYKNPTPNNSPYFFLEFLKKSDTPVLRHFSGNFPETTDYFEVPDLLLFNPKLELIPDIDHIIDDNIDRFPPHLKVADKAELRRQVYGSIQDITKRVRNNYKIAVPQYYNGNIQLLLPLCLTDGSPNPDLALVVHRVNNTTYSARTCLTLRMAYNNARLIVKPESNWLKP